MITKWNEKRRVADWNNREKKQTNLLQPTQHNCSHKPMHQRYASGKTCGTHSRERADDDQSKSQNHRPTKSCISMQCHSSAARLTPADQSFVQTSAGTQDYADIESDWNNTQSVTKKVSRSVGRSKEHLINEQPQKLRTNSKTPQSIGIRSRRNVSISTP